MQNAYKECLPHPPMRAQDYPPLRGAETTVLVLQLHGCATCIMLLKELGCSVLWRLDLAIT